MNTKLFKNLSFKKFANNAKNSKLSIHEKVGFPDEYRKNKEKLIFNDFLNKLKNINKKNQTILEIGPGCSNLPKLLSEHCKKKSSQVIFVDSKEMLDYINDDGHIKKYFGKFPNVFRKDISSYHNKIDVIIVYSVIQYVFSEDNLWDFIDSCLLLLKEGGQLLIGDIPNSSMRKRFFMSDKGIKYHKKYFGRDEKPSVIFNNLSPGEIDDSIVIAIISRARLQGFNAWIVPQSKSLPMSNRREDIVIQRP